MSPSPPRPGTGRPDPRLARRAPPPEEAAARAENARRRAEEERKRRKRKTLDASAAELARCAPKRKSASSARRKRAGSPKRRVRRRNPLLPRNAPAPEEARRAGKWRAQAERGAGGLRRQPKRSTVACQPRSGAGEAAQGRRALLRAEQARLPRADTPETADSQARSRTPGHRRAAAARNRHPARRRDPGRCPGWTRSASRRRRRQPGRLPLAPGVPRKPR